MDEKEYLQLLEKAYEDLPTVLYKKERFEIPKVSGRIEKSRTIVTNFREIAKDLTRPENHFSRFFLKEVGVRGEITPRGELTLAAKFQPGILNRTVERYFENYVKCEHCSSPDTDLNLQEGVIVCKACGHRTKVANL
ncbi:MAG: translation initiation factor IF-2 subunit beta [Nanoarchaeota archaeon]